MELTRPVDRFNIIARWTVVESDEKRRNTRDTNQPRTRDITFNQVPIKLINRSLLYRTPSYENRSTTRIFLATIHIKPSTRRKYCHSAYVSNREVEIRLTRKTFDNIRIADKK